MSVRGSRVSRQRGPSDVGEVSEVDVITGKNQVWWRWGFKTCLLLQW